MAQLSFTHGKSALAREFTFPGKRPSRLPTALAGSLSVLLLLGPIEPAAARPQIGPTSSASVGISLSVAPQYGLRADDAVIGAVGAVAAGYCMTTNGKRTALPVHLILHGVREPAAVRISDDMAGQLNWCGNGGEGLPLVARGEEASLLIVRPE